MGTTIDDAIEVLDMFPYQTDNGEDMIDACEMAIETMRKFQKIREIAFPLQFCSTDKLEHEAIMKICEVLEDGEID